MSAVFAATGRGGNEGINVRGLEGNQVLLQTDGVRLPLMYDSGPFVAGRGDYIDVEAFKRVELLRGPSSASYGSDGVAGAVSFLTKDPEDLLTLGRPRQGSLKLGYASADRSWLAVPSFAVRQGDWQGMVLASLRRGHELENRGDRDTGTFLSTVPNPQERRSDYVLGKLVYRLDPRQQFKLTLEHLDRRVDTDPIRTVIGMPLVNANVTGARARDDVTRTMGKLDWQYADAQNPWVQRLSSWVYVQRSENRQFGEERYNTAPLPPATPPLWGRRTRDTQYAEHSVGLGLQGESRIQAGVEQRLLWGLDYSDARISSIKNGAHYDGAGTLITAGPGSASNSFPNQSSPDSDYRLLGAFVQDEIRLGDWRITPALRVDRFEIDPDAGNALYTRNNPVPPSKLGDTAISPRLGALWQLAPLFQPYAQLSRGFRAPTPWQINGGISNQGANPPYRSIGNPDLKPERSTAFEIGLRGREGPLRYGLAYFKARYRDFIVANADVTDQTGVPLEPGMLPDTRTFQSVNAARAEISGFELSGAFNVLPGWWVEGQYARARGDGWGEDGARAPLSTIEPEKAVLRLRYERPQAWGGEFTLVAQRAQKRPYAADLDIPKGHVVADLATWWELDRQWQLALAVHNIGDVKYALWSDVRGLATGSAVADAYTQPGRNASVSLRWQF